MLRSKMKQIIILALMFLGLVAAVDAFSNLTDGLQACWSLDQTLLDASNNTNNLSQNGAGVKNVSGIINTSMNFTTAANYLKSKKVINFAGNKATFIFWFNTTDTGSTNR